MIVAVACILVAAAESGVPASCCMLSDCQESMSLDSPSDDLPCLLILQAETPRPEDATVVASQQIRPAYRSAPMCFGVVILTSYSKRRIVRSVNRSFALSSFSVYALRH